MDEPRSVRVHRCRFIDWTPRAITAIAFPPRALPTPSKGKQPEKETEIKPGYMAVGRANGNIELYNWAGEGAAQAWILHATLYGPAGSKVDNLIFTLRHPDSLSLTPWDTPPLFSLRLFSTTSGSELYEWSLSSLSITRTLPSGGGSIWSLAANPASTKLAMGCEDGGVRVVDLREGELALERRFDRVKPRLLSLAWGPPVLKPKADKRTTNEKESDEDDDDEDEEEEDPWGDTFLITGCSDSSLRKWDVRTGRMLGRLTLDKTRNEPTLAWAVGVLPDGTVVSGDSMGAVKFWDSGTGTQLQSLASHQADVLALIIGPNGRTVYTTGVDQKITEHTLVSLPHQPARWVQTTSRRLHAHDVRALSIFPPMLPHPKGAVTLTCPVLVSGGLDLAPVLTPAAPVQKTDAHGAGAVANLLKTSKAATWAESWHRRLPYTRRGEMSVLRKRGWVVCRREQAVGIWYLKTVSEGEEGGWDKVLEMELAGQGNLVCIAVGEPGDSQPAWLAVSDGGEVKLWQLLGEKEDIRPKRVKSFIPTVVEQLADSEGTLGASALVFTPSASHLLVATTPSCQPGSTILFLDVADLSVVARLTPPKSANAESWISEIVVSSDGHYCASLGVAGLINIYDLRTLKHYATLPSFPSHPTALTFLPTSPALLVIVLANNTLHSYSLQYRRLDDVTKRSCAALSARLGMRHDPILGLSTRSKPEGEGEVFIWGSSWVCRADLMADASSTVDEPSTHRKRKRTGNPDAFNLALQSAEEIPPLRVETRYKYICLVDFVGGTKSRAEDAMEVDEDGPMKEAQEDEMKEMMVVVERPVADVLTEGPGAFNRKKFGT